MASTPPYLLIRRPARSTHAPPISRLPASRLGLPPRPPAVAASPPRRLVASRRLPWPCSRVRAQNMTVLEPSRGFEVDGREVEDAGQPISAQWITSSAVQCSLTDARCVFVIEKEGES